MKPFSKTNCRLLVLYPLFIIMLGLTGYHAHAQSMGISSIAITPDASSILELRTTTKGMLIPRMTTTERDAISSPATGLMIYNSTTSKFNFYNGSSWVAFLSGSTGVNSVSGTTNRITIGGTSADPIVDISSGYVGQNSITTLGTIGTGTWNGTLISPTYGGTGVNNGSNTITLGGNLTTSGAFPTTLTSTATTNVTLPTTGTLSTLDGTETLTNKTLTSPVINSPTGIVKADVGLGNVENTALSTWAGSTNLTTFGTIGTGTWNGTLISPAYGGTGVNNGSNTITLGGNLTTSGAFATTLTSTATTNVTLPTTGTLSTLAGTETLTNKTLTSPILTTPTLGIASATSQTITGTAGEGFLELQSQSSAPATGPSNSVRMFSNAGGLGWKRSDGFVRSFSSTLTADRTYTLPDASGTVAVSASGNIALSAAGNINFTGTLPIANGGSNSTATPTNGGIAYGNGSAYQFSAAGTSGQILRSNGAAAPTWINSINIVTLGSDVTTSSTANAITDVTGLSFSVLSGVTYNFRATIIFSSTATNLGTRWSINGPASPTLLGYVSQVPNGVAAVVTSFGNAYDLPAATTGNSAYTTGNIVLLDGIITPSADGTVIVRFASESGSSATAKAGSTLTWW